MQTIATRRILAFAIDSAIFLLLNALCILIADNDGWIYFLVCLVIFCLLNSVLEGLGGQSLGKMILHIKIISSRFYKVNFPIALKRNIVKLLILPISAIIYLINGNESEAWHDKISGTEVVII